MSVRRDSPFDEIVDSGDEAVNRAAVLLTRMQHRLNPSAEFRTSLQRHVSRCSHERASAVEAPRGRSLSSRCGGRRRRGQRPPSCWSEPLAR